MFRSGSVVASAGAPRDDLAAARPKGQRLGRPVSVPADVKTRLHEMRDDGKTFVDIAEVLNAEGVPTARGGERWWPSAVGAVLNRAS